MQSSAVGIILWQSLAIFLLFSAAVGVVLSLLLIFKPHLVERISRATDRWVSVRNIVEPMDRPISIEGWFFKNHRPMGLLVMLGSGYILTTFGLMFDKGTAIRRLTHYAPANLLDILVDGLVFFALLGSVVALFIGLFMWLRPSMLRGAEELSDQWISLRGIGKPLSTPHDHVEVFVARHRQRVGWVLLLGSIYLSFVTFHWLVGQA